MLPVLICKDVFTSRLDQSREVLNQNTLDFARIFLALVRNFLALRETYIRPSTNINRSCPYV